MHESSFRCCYGIMTRDHGAFNYLYRWSVRHMLTEFLMVAILVYLQFTDRYAGIWSMSAAIISLIGASIPSLCFSNAPGWRVNFGLQVLVVIIRIAVVAFIIWSFTKNFQDTELASNRICQLATILLSTLSLSPLFHMSLKSSWLINMRPMDMRGPNAQGGRGSSGREFLMGSRDYGNGGRPYPNSNSTSRKSFDLESNNINSNNNSNNNIGMSMSNASSMREKYMRDPEIEKIAEGNEEEGEGEDNGDEFRSEIASSTMSYATLAPFYQPKAKKTTDFSNKEDVLFSYENVMHSSKKSPPDSLSIRSSNINSNVNTSGNSNSQKEDVVYQEKVFQDNPMGSHHNSGRFRLSHDASAESLGTNVSWISRTNSGRLPHASSARGGLKDEERMVHGGGGSGGTAGSGGDELFSIGGCDVGISGKSIRSLHPPLRGDIAHAGMGVAATGTGGVVGGGGVLAGTRVESEFDVTKFGSPHQPQKGNVSKEVNLSFI